MENLIKLKKFWKGKKVFVTGHTGFKGSWLIIFLNLLGAKIYGYSLKEEKKSLFYQIKRQKILIKNIVGNVCNLNNLEKEIRKIKPDIVFHLAAQSLVSESFIKPLETFNTNFIGTLNILHCIRKIRSIKSAVIVTTDKVYKTKKINKFYKEHDELGGVDPYSSSKVCAELVSFSYINSFFKSIKMQNRVSTARSGNVIGGGDYSKDRLVPDIINSIRYKKKLIIRNPNSIRPWLHVIEPLYGYLILAEKQYKNKLINHNTYWNFGPKKNNFKKVISIVNLFIKKEKIKFSMYSNKKFIETKILKLNSQKSKKYLNWFSKWDINTIIEKVLEWNTFSKRNKNIIKICEKQIRNYFNQ